MWNPFKFVPLIDSNRTDWIKRHWLLFENYFNIGKREMVLPTKNEFLAVLQAEFEYEEDFVESLINIIIEKMRIKKFKFNVQPHSSSSEINSVISSYGAATQGQDPAGTYSYDHETDCPLITYDPILIQTPVDLIATLSHEISHHIIKHSNFYNQIESNDEEFVTDLSVVYHGFGMFQMRSSLRMENWTQGQWSGWKLKRSGYLSLAESSYATAFFSKNNDCDVDAILNHLDDLQYSYFIKAMKQISKE